MRKKNYPGIIPLNMKAGKGKNYAMKFFKREVEILENIKKSENTLIIRKMTEEERKKYL